MMSQYVLPLAATVFAWWISTGIVLLVVRRPAWPGQWTTIGATPVLIAGFYALSVSSSDATSVGAYVAFVSALLIWAWIEVSFLTGAVTGPTRAPCPPEAVGWRRVVLAVQAILYHEIILLACGAFVVLLTLGADNLIGLWTYVLLWAMRLSAKLNLFLGVRNLGTEFLPASLAFLASYFRRRAVNPLFPVSVGVSTIATVLLVRQALLPGAGEFHVAGFMMLATLMALAAIEHWFLVLPVEISPLWQWALEVPRGGARQPSKTFGSKETGSLSKRNSPVLPVIVRPASE